MRHRIINGRRRHVQGWRASHVDHRDFIAAEPPTAVVLPTTADLRPICPPVRDQGARGTCGANSAAEAMGFLYTKQGKPDPMLSRLFIYYYTRKIEGTPATEDSGVALRDVMKCLAIYGSALESTWPYSDDDVAFTQEPSHEAVMEAKNHQALLYYRCASLRSIKASLSQGFPIVGGFQCPSNMFSDDCTRTGVIQYPGPTEGFEGGHAVLVVGYDDVKEQLIFQNSWGTSWGDFGYGYLPYLFVTNKLADDFWTLRREEM